MKEARGVHRLQVGAPRDTFWMIKRVIVDGWTTERAVAEAESLKMTDEGLRTFALRYIGEHKQL